MQNERANHNPGWKEKLEELESSPDGIFDKEATWDKLHKRMQPKEKSNKALWYWIAAACILFALCTPFFLSDRKENGFAKNNLTSNKVQTRSFQKPMDKKDTVLIISSSTKNKIPYQPVDDYDKQIVIAHHKVIKPELIDNLKNKPEIFTKEIIDASVMPVDTAINIAALLPGKKKLKVIHINELGEPVIDAPDIAGFYDRRLLQLKFINKESSIASSHYANNKVLKNFAKINLASN